MSPRSDSISIVVVCYNEGPLLRRAIDRIDAQTDRDFELVIVKNASDCAETRSICRGLEPRSRTKVLYREVNDGNSGGRNAGFAAATGSLLIPCDGDDVLPPHVVATVRSTFARKPEADYVFGDYLLVNVDTGESRVMDCSAAADGEGWLDGRQFARGVMFHGASPCRRELWRKVGGYRRSAYGWQDVDFWMNAIGRGGRGRYVNATLYEWHRREGGLNSRTPPHRTWEVSLRNRAFQRRFGDWRMLCEGFLDYAVATYASPEARRVVRRNVWRLMPLPLPLLGMCVRACAKCWLPVRWGDALTRIKAQVRQQHGDVGEQRRGGEGTHGGR